MIKAIAIGSDHAGFELKENLKEFIQSKGIEVIDKGCFSLERADYPDYAHKVAIDVINNEGNIGVLICGSGNGIAMSANKHKGIRAAICWKEEIASLARQHNDANILVLPARFIDEISARNCLDIFLNTKFEEGRHTLRVSKIDIL